MSQTRKQKITRHNARYLKKSKGYQIRKFDQFTEYSMRNIFLEKCCTICGGKTSPRPFF